MEKDQENSVWSKLWDSIKFCKESKSGKYSLDIYLDIVGEYTDGQIKLAETEGLIYLGGECQITNSYDTQTYDFEVKMYFEDSKGEKIVKEARRNMPKDRFVSETDQKIGDKIRFEIQKPN